VPTSASRLTGPAARRLLAGAGVATVAVACATALAAPAISAPAAAGGHTGRAARAARAAKPGVSGGAITLASQVSFPQGARTYSMATDASGTTYVAWIAASVVASAGRQLHLCTLPLHATGCKGGVQTADLTDASTSGDLRLLVTPGGAVTIVWYHTDSGGGEIAEATRQQDGLLSAEQDVASAPVNGNLLDAELGPGNAIWTVATGSGSPLEVREGLTNAPVTVHVPYDVQYAQLAFSGATPILALVKAAFVTQAVGFTYQSGDSWTSVKNVPGTGTDASAISLVRTRLGVRLVADVGDAGYTPVVAKWTGHGFGKPVKTGDTCELGYHAAVTDSSGRLADASSECGKIVVSSMADTVHAATVKFSTPQVPAGGEPQIATLPSGHAWVAVSTQYNPSQSQLGDVLKLYPVLLPDRHATASKKGKGGTTVVTGPESCLPADTVAVSVKGHPKHGWKVSSRKLKLGAHSAGSSVNGGALVAGKSYTLKGTVVFAKNGSHSSVSAKLTFKVCPAP
jgi:hypothetical protein